MSSSDTQFENTQLMDLVNSAEILFQQLYNFVSDKHKPIIDNWLCLKQELDSVCNNSIVDSYENLDESSMLSPIDEVSENETNSLSSSIIGRPSKTISRNLQSCALNEQSSKLINENKSRRSCATSDKINLDENVDEYISEFKLFTDVLSSLWISDLSFSLLVSDDDKMTISDGNKTHLSERIGQETNRTRRGRQMKHHLHVDGGADEIPAASVNDSCKSNFSITDHTKEIKHLQELRLPLIQTRRKIMDTNRSNNEQLETSSNFKPYIKYEIVIEVLDISIEMKNQLRLGHDILDTFEINDQADKAIADCFSMLSLNETKYLLATFLKKVTDIREASAKVDKEILKQDSFLFYQKLLIRNLNKTIANNKLLYETQCVNLQKQYEKKLEAARKVQFRSTGANDVTVESGVEFNGNQNPTNALSILRTSELLPSYSQADTQGVKTEHFKAILDAVTSNSNLKALHGSNNNPTDVKVTRQKNKLIIQQERNNTAH